MVWDVIPAGEGFNDDAGESLISKKHDLCEQVRDCAHETGGCCGADNPDDLIAIFGSSHLAIKAGGMV